MACISIPTAMLVSGGVSALGGLASAAIGSSAATSAAKLQSDAAEKAAQQQMKMFESVRGDLSPFVSAGKGALTGVNELLGIGTGGMGSPEVMARLASTPGYQFALDQGLQATQNSYASKGLGSSGAALKGAADYAEGLAGTTYQSMIGNFMGLAGLGENAAAQTGTLGLQSQAGVNSLMTGAASAQAAGQVGSANALMGGIGNITSAFDNTALMLALNKSGMFGGTTNALSPDPNAWATNGWGG